MDGKIPPISESNANMIRAACMNQIFPQEVIAFYQQRIRFNKSLDSKEEEAKKAALALLHAKERRNELHLKRVAKEGEANDDDDDDDDDPATKAIEREKRTYDKFDPTESDLNSSSSDEENVLLMDSDDE